MKAFESSEMDVNKFCSELLQLKRRCFGYKLGLSDLWQCMSLMKYFQNFWHQLWNEDFLHVCSCQRIKMCSTLRTYSLSFDNFNRVCAGICNLYSSPQSVLRNWMLIFWPKRTRLTQQSILHIHSYSSSFRNISTI